MTLNLDLQNESGKSGVPSRSEFERWVEASLRQDYSDLEQTIRVVEENESQSLNAQFRDVNKSTNVLAFPAEDDYLDYECLGDLVICAPVVEREASEQGKELQAHWAHMVIHGMLHLQGFDHDNDSNAAQMESLEIKILGTLGYTNPYNG